MALEKWHPLKDLENMRREMDKIWEEMLPSTRRAFLDMPWARKAAEKEPAAPAIDIIDREDEVVVKADMPGVDKDDLEVSLRGDTLTIKGEMKDERETADENYFYSERHWSSYSRSVDIPCKVTPDKIKASLKHGILTVRLPKAEERKPRKIKVEIA